MTLRRDPIVIGGLVLAGTALVVGLLLSLRGADTAPDAPTTGGEILALEDVDDLSALNGQRVTVDRARVDSVPADEGFWVAVGGGRVWVQLTTAGESPFEVEPGDRVTFAGDVATHGRDFADRPEFSAADAEELIDAGAHVEVDVGDLRLDRDG